MRDTELYRHLLGLETPWMVGRVELSATDGRVDVWVEHPARTGAPVSTCSVFGLDRPSNAWVRVSFLACRYRMISWVYE